VGQQTPVLDAGRSSVRIDRFRRDAASAKKEALQARAEKLGCTALVTRELLARGKQIGDDPTKYDYISAMKKYFLAEDFPAGIPKHVRDSVVYPPDLGSLWDGTRTDVWTDPDWELEPLYTGFRMMLTGSSGQVKAFSRYDSDDKFRRPEVPIPPEAVVWDRPGQYVFDAMAVADPAELREVLRAEGIAAPKESSALDATMEMGRKAPRILMACESFRICVVDILEADGTSLVDEPRSVRRFVLSSLGLGGRAEVSESMTGTAMEKVKYCIKCGKWTDGCAAKRGTAKYAPGERAWTKLKSLRVFDHNSAVVADARDGQAFVRHPALGEVLVVEEVGFQGRCMLTFHGGTLTSVTAFTAKDRDRFVLWDPDDFDVVLPQKLEVASAVTAVAGTGFSLRELIGG
jgi:hypothetical protein